MSRRNRIVQHADWHTLLSNEQLERADKRAQERLDEQERQEIRRKIKRKIPVLIKKVERSIRKGNRPEASIIVSPFLASNDRKLIAEVVNDELAKAGAPGLKFTNLYAPTSNSYVPVPSGIFTRLYIGKGT